MGNVCSQISICIFNLQTILNGSLWPHRSVSPFEILKIVMLASADPASSKYPRILILQQKVLGKKIVIEKTVKPPY